MSTRLNPYLSFKDTTADVMNFYQGIFGGKLDISTFAENGMAEDPSEATKVMHSMLTTDGGMVLMASDTPNAMEYKPNANGTVSLSGEDEAEIRGYYDKLSADGGTVTLPLEKAPWGDYFGMCTDKFGVNWMFNISGPAGTNA